MSVPNKVRFHITEAGPKKCVAVKACPKAPDATHYDNYVDAARAYEKDLASSNSSFAPKLSKSSNMSYESLQSPQADDLERTKMQVKGYFYTGSGEMASEIGAIHRELWFDNQIENIVAISSEDLQKLKDLRKEAIDVKAANAPGAFSKSRDIKASIEEVLSTYRGRESYGPYKEFLESHFQNSPEIQGFITKFATPIARSKVFSRALENNVAIPQELSLEFETIWNSDEFTPGSQTFMEKEIRVAANKKERLLTSSNQEALASELGFPNFKQASFTLTDQIDKLRDYHTHRGRNYPKTVNAVIQKFNLFQD